MTGFEQSISQAIWDIKYRYRSKAQAAEQTIDDTWCRVAKAVASVEHSQTNQAYWQKQFYHILQGFKFLPGGRILAGAGTTHKVTLFNCFVMAIANDSLESIFSALQEGALTLQEGGGVGYDFSILRPAGSDVKTTGVIASGPVAFMRIWDAMCAALLSTGARRGAMMGVLRCDHPDIEAFIAAKADARELRHFNLSVLVSDALMDAVATDSDWHLTMATGQRVHTLKARVLWQKIINSAYDYAEPGVLFADTINKQNNLWYKETITATNPCGEIPLPGYGACNLGAINLTQFIIDAFSTKARINWPQLEETVRIATRFLDNIIDLSHYPLPAQKQQALHTRRIGLGLTGLADSLVMLNLIYGSAQAITCARDIMHRISKITWLSSIELGKERGSFAYYQPEYLAGEFIKNLDAEVVSTLQKHKVMRNSHHNTIAPTGTISLLANNVSNGIEPIFAGQYSRYVRTGNETRQEYIVTDYALLQWRKNHDQHSLPPALIATEQLTPDDHLAMQAALQPYIDNAISKTINLPEDFPFEKVSDIYTKAHALGLKGCTIFRPNAVTGRVLAANTAKEKPMNGNDGTDSCCQFGEG
jgi:ribonucleoside-diphosphate reductase alpha chain